MAKKPSPLAVMPPLPSGASVEEFAPQDLGQLPLFAGLAKSGKLASRPGSFRLRKFQPGELICRQGDYTTTAFYVLTRQDLAALGKPVATVGLGDEPLRVATANVFSSPAPARPADGGWLRRLFGRRTQKTTGAPPLSAPRSIPADTLLNIDYDTRQGRVFEGDIFGEASCMSNRPRSATVVADREWYAVEMLRNLFTELQRDKTFRGEIDEVYRQRVLSDHLRQFSLFDTLSDEQLRTIRNRVDLLRIEPDAIIFDQGDPPDALYIVRSGLVQVVQSNYYIEVGELGETWHHVRDALLSHVSPAAGSAAAANDDPRAGATGKLAELLSESLRRQLAASSGNAEQDEQIIGPLVEALRAIAKTRDLLLMDECQVLMESSAFLDATRQFSNKKVKQYSDFEVRIANRALFYALLPDAILPPPPPDSWRVLSYLAKGEIFGEMGIVVGKPRNATCIAFDHPDPNHKTGLVELLRIPVDALRDLWEISPALYEDLKKRTALREQKNVQPVRSSPVVNSPRYGELGLIQGQRLMLIDLDSCTRCGECVQACINTHDDGHTRLYLDGPRFDRYLVPTSCRNCRDPVCMIGCPVGSIQPGENGQIVIRDWCIGCGLCAKQCPYDSIQMHDTGLVSEISPHWRYTPSSRINGTRWHTLRYNDRHWLPTSTPVRWDLETVSSIRGLGHVDYPADQPVVLCFRHAFTATRAQTATTQTYTLKLASETEDCRQIQVMINGVAVPVEQQKDETKYEATIAGQLLRSGENVLAVSLAAPRKPDALVLGLHLYQVTDTMLDQYKQHAAVCDQCSTMPFGPACVYACPHEAAMRLDGLYEFPQA